MQTYQGNVIVKSQLKFLIKVSKLMLFSHWVVTIRCRRKNDEQQTYFTVNWTRRDKR